MKSIGSSLSALAFMLVACGGPQTSTAPAPAATVQPIPAGYYSITPIIVVRDVQGAIDFYTRAFGAQMAMLLPGPDGSPIHGEVKIGDSIIMIGPGAPEQGSTTPEQLGGSPASLTYYVEDADTVFARAVEAGAQVEMPIQDMFWGDRYGMVVDPYGHRWGIATHKEDLTPEQMMARMQASMGGGGEMPAGTPAKSYKQDGYHSITPGITVNDAAAAIEFYKAALGATERSRMPMPDGRLIHAEVQIGNSVLMLSDAFPEMGSKSAQELGGSPMALMMYVPDADAVHTRAVGVRAQSTQAPADMFWGDRFGEVLDPFGYRWGIATHKEDLSPAQIVERMNAATPPAS